MQILDDVSNPALFPIQIIQAKKNTKPENKLILGNNSTYPFQNNRGKKGSLS